MGKLKRKIFKGVRDPGLFASTVILDAHPKLFQYFDKYNPTQYDKIMDQVYNKTHIGGSSHRHFDGSHTFKGSYDKIEATTGSVDFVKYFKSQYKELITPEGIPLFTLDKRQHEIVSNQISESLDGLISSGQIRKYIRDFNSFNIGETVSSGIGAIFLFFALRSGNAKAISRVTAMNICLGMATANPLQLFIGVVGLASGVYRGKIQSYDLLRGSTSAISGIFGYQIARHLFNFSKNNSIMFSIGTTIASEMLLNHLESKKQKTILRELGTHNSHYITALTYEILRAEFIKLSLNSPKLALGSLI